MLRNEFFALVFTTWAISQTIKYLLQLYTIRNFSLGHLKKTYLYSSGLPSTHASVLTCSFLYMYNFLGPSDPMVFVLFVFGYLWLFEIYMQRRRFQAQIELLDDLGIKKLKHSEVQLYKDLSGHDLSDIAAGLLLGSLVFWVFLSLGIFQNIQ